jgi:hypothetical protein
MARNKLAKKRKHKRDVAEKRRARAFYRMREQDRESIDEAMSEAVGTAPGFMGIVVVLVALAGIVIAVYHTVRTIINM